MEIHTDSRSLLVEMIAQLLNAHTHSYFLHLGCAEVRSCKHVSSTVHFMYRIRIPALNVQCCIRAYSTVHEYSTQWVQNSFVCRPFAKGVVWRFSYGVLVRIPKKIMDTVGACGFACTCIFLCSRSQSERLLRVSLLAPASFSRTWRRSRRPRGPESNPNSGCAGGSRSCGTSANSAAYSSPTPSFDSPQTTCWQVSEIQIRVLYIRPAKSHLSWIFINHLFLVFTTVVI